MKFRQIFLCGQLDLNPVRVEERLEDSGPGCFPPGGMRCAERLDRGLSRDVRCRLMRRQLDLNPVRVEERLEDSGPEATL